MERIYYFGLSFLLVILLQQPTQAQICSGPEIVQIPENNTIGQVVTRINTTMEGVTLELTANPGNLFEIRGTDLVAREVLDYEDQTLGNLHFLKVLCTRVNSTNVQLTIAVEVTDVNDNPPVFDQSQYYLNVTELLPDDTVVGTYTATDKDQISRIYYRLESEPEGFNMKSPISPDIIVTKNLDYDTIKEATLKLYAQDTDFSPPVVPSFTATATIHVTIQDIDNRPPWFQPCTLYTPDGGKMCMGNGYTGSVNLTEQEEGALPLEPGPIYAIDGDFGINEEIEYTILSGNKGNLFQINANTGNITMTKPADVAGPIQLTVLATQKLNVFQFATTLVSIRVQTVTLNPPRFEKPQYSGFIVGVGTMALDPDNDNQPLMIQAKDADYAGGVNPAIKYTIVGSADFAFINGYLFMTKNLPFGDVTFQVEAEDSTTGESTTAGLTIEVKDGILTTSVSPGTTEITPGTTEITPGTTEITPGTTEITPGTTDLPTPGTTDKTPSTSLPTANTAHPPPEGSGGYGPEDMAALGASLAVLLVICMVVIGVLGCQLQKGKTAWKKITEASLFRSSLGQGSGGMKEGVQYTNEGFQNDEDADSAGSPGQEEVTGKAGGKPGTKDIPLEETIMKSTAPLHSLLDDNASMTGSDKADSEKEVKPILTKERRNEEGYKSVWFKEDIDPNAKDEVVIIPDNRGQDGEEDDDDDDDDEESLSGREDDDMDSLSTTMSIPKASLTDMDSGIEVKIQDQAGDSGDDNSFTVDL